jgi:hypothetical protein
LNEYGSALPKIALVFFYQNNPLSLLFLPKYRNAIRFWLFSLLYFICFLFCKMESVNTSSGMNVRYNFIAVNYLIYTNEVIGNIMESYPVIPLFSVCIIHYCISLSKKSKNYIENIPSYIQKIKISGIYLLLFWCCIASFCLFINERKLAKCICEWVTSQRHL